MKSAITKEDVKRLYHQYKGNVSEFARIVCEDLGVSYTDSDRRKVSRYIDNVDISSSHSHLAETCETIGIPLDQVKSYWYKSKNISINTSTQQKFDSQKFLDSISELISEVAERPRLINKVSIKGTKKALKVTISDSHVGLEPNQDDRSLFRYEYNSDIYNQHMDHVYHSILKEFNANGKFDKLILDDLGDALDGFNGETTRGGHKLPQNMSNPECFTTYVNGKLRLIESVLDLDIADSIEIRSVSRCNHGGDFGEIANITIKMLIERLYPSVNVKVTILKRFIEHFEYGDHCYLLTHGKDDKHMKHGLPLNLDFKTIKFINDYIDHYGINSKYIHVEKGDLHQLGYQRTKKFTYRNFCSFAPPSSWQQHGFGDAYAGYSIQIIEKYSGNVSHTDYEFDLKKRVN